MKLAIGGKGGVGKTTIAACLAKAFAEEGYSVLAIDADTNSTLPSAFGLPRSTEIMPICKMEDLICERTGAKPGEIGGFFKLNPKVDDLPERCSVVHDGIRIMVMGAIKTGGTGCYCPENALLKALVTHLLLGRKEVVIMDMEAGVEHLGRGTAYAVDRLIIVVEPGRRSVETALTVKALAEEIGLKRIAILGNKIRGPRDEAYLNENMKEFQILGFLPYSDQIIEGDMENEPPYTVYPEMLQRMKDIIRMLKEP